MKSKHARLLICILLLNLLACRPIITVGWQEILILIVLLIVLSGPALFRIYRRWDDFQKWKERQDRNPKEK